MTMKNIPVINVVGKNLPEAFENAIVSLYDNGTRFKTQYDKPEDPESIDATLIMVDLHIGVLGSKHVIRHFMKN
jgi:hypothetical protein